MKKKLSTKFLAFSLILCIVLSCTLSAYSSAYIVYAGDMDDDAQEVAKNIALMALSIAGVVIAPEAFTPIFLMQLGVEGVDMGLTIGKHIIDNGDGTATIKADDIQMIADIAQASNGFGDSYYDRIGRKGSYTYYGSMSINHRPGSNSYIRASGRFTSDYPIVIYLTSNGLESETHAPYYYRVESKTKYGSSISFSTYGYQLYNGKYTYNTFSNYGWNPSNSETGSFISNAPVFLKKSDAIEYIETGGNAKDALNYNPELNPDFRYGSNHNPKYSGGDFTFNLNKLSTFTNYYTQVINNYPNNDDTDKVLKILLDYIKGDSYDLSISRHDNSIITEGEQNTIEVEILTNIENPDYNNCLTWHGIGIDSVSYSGNIATLTLSQSIHEGEYNLSAVYDNGDDIYIISPNLTLTVKEGEKETEPPTPPPPDEPSDAWIKIKSASDNDYLSLSANQREFFIETNLNNPYYESCLTWYPLNGVENVQYTNTNTAILTFKEYSKRYNVYCKYIDPAKEINITSNTVSATTGRQEIEGEEPDRWDKFIENVYQFFDDIMAKHDEISTALIDKLNEIFYDSNANNYFRLIKEDILIFLEQFQFFAADCLGYLKDIMDSIGSNKKLPALPSPDGNDKGWDFLEFLMDISKDITENSLDEGAQKVGSLITEILSGLADCFTMLSEIFPFSIPWDIAALVGALAREPETPHFEIPLKLERYGIDEKLVIDLAGFDYVSKISRAFMSLIWAMYLMNFTVKFTDTKNL